MRSGVDKERGGEGECWSGSGGSGKLDGIISHDRSVSRPKESGGSETGALADGITEGEGGCG